MPHGDLLLPDFPLELAVHLHARASGGPWGLVLKDPAHLVEERRGGSLPARCDPRLGPAAGRSGPLADTSAVGRNLTASSPGKTGHGGGSGAVTGTGQFSIAFFTIKVCWTYFFRYVILKTGGK